jgi:L-ribulose-5-phosphate 3-epimerase UlaE
MRQHVRSDLMEMAVDIREEYVTESNWSDRSRAALSSLTLKEIRFKILSCFQAYTAVE